MESLEALVACQRDPKDQLEMTDSVTKFLSSRSLTSENAMAIDLSLPCGVKTLIRLRVQHYDVCASNEGRQYGFVFPCLVQNSGAISLTSMNTVARELTANKIRLWNYVTSFVGFEVQCLMFDALDALGGLGAECSLLGWCTG